MILKTKLDWQGYETALAFERLPIASPEATAVTGAIQAYRDRVHEMQEVLREIVHGNGPAAHRVARVLLEDYTPPSQHDMTPVSESEL